MLKRFISHSLIYGILPQIPRIGSLFILPIITRDLTSIDFGISGIITTYTAAFSIFHTLGLAVVLNNSFYQNQNQYKWLWRQLFGFLSVWSIVYGIVTCAILYFAIPEAAKNNTWLIIALNIIPMVFFEPTNFIGTRFYQLNGKALPLGLRTMTIGLINISLNLYFISHMKLGYMGWFWASFISYSVGFLIFINPVHFKYKLTPILNFKKRIIKKSLKVSLPIVPHQLSTYLVNLSDRMVMSFLKVDIAQIGFYNVSSNFAMYFSAIGEAMSTALTPIYMTNIRNSERENKPNYSSRALIFIIQIFFLILTFLVSIWLKEIFQILIKNEELQKSYGLAIIMIMGFNYYPMYWASTLYLFYFEKTKGLWKISFMAGIINVLLNFIFIPIYGIQTAAYTTFISTMYLGYACFFTSEYKSIPGKLNHYPLIWFSATCLNLIAAYYIVGLPPSFKMSISSAIFIFSVILLLNKNNIARKFSVR